jgi:hypothetical protein
VVSLKLFFFIIFIITWVNILGVHSGCAYWVYILGVHIGCTYWVCILGVHIGCAYWVCILGVPYYQSSLARFC